jgi:flagellar motor switch protein FliG
MDKELEFLSDVLAQFLTKEDDEVVAKILSRLDAALPAVLSRLPEEKQGEVVFHLFRLREAAHGLMGWTARDIGGLRAVAEIINRSGSSTEKKILDYVDGQDPRLAERLRNEMFRFEDIANLADEHIRVVFRECDPVDLAVGLKGCDEGLTERLLAAVSDEQRALIEERTASLGATRVSDIGETRLRIVQQARQQEERGNITIVRGEGDFVY